MSAQAAAREHAAAQTAQSIERLIGILDKAAKHPTAQIAGLLAQLSRADFYQESPDDFYRATTELETARDQLNISENRWLELEDLIN